DTIAQKNLIAFAPEFKAKDERLNLVFRQEFLSSLKYNRKEIKGISKWIKADLLTNEDATKENFLKLSPMYKIIHLATHGQANNKRGEYSFLAFSAANDSIELLHASDLYNIDLPAELIVLSACETGVGELKRGEGILSLARGFSFAGVKSILTTLWKVSDKKAASFMDFFYKNISEGLQKDEALRKAKIAYMANCSKREAAPFYWASYIAMGDMDAIELFPEPEESFLLWYILSGLCIVGMALSFYLWREKLVEISRRPVSSIAGWFRR
ncbi:MAG TPA: CHAT domain-containing protein, partial [Saprospiraceae bacterium]|nr:CHAT domain-containing protein [Saprospiraceae bacterium]